MALVQLVQSWVSTSIGWSQQCIAMRYALLTGGMSGCGVLLCDSVTVTVEVLTMLCTVAVPSSLARSGSSRLEVGV